MPHSIIIVYVRLYRATNNFVYSIRSQIGESDERARTPEDSAHIYKFILYLDSSI